MAHFLRKGHSKYIDSLGANQSDTGVATNERPEREFPGPSKFWVVIHKRAEKRLAEPKLSTAVSRGLATPLLPVYLA